MLFAFALSFLACENDYNTLNSNVINGDNASNFNINSLKYDITTYNKTVGAVQTNGIGINALGFYNDVYGSTTANILTQITPASYSPNFGENTVMDSVVLTIPYFSTRTEIDDDGNIVYKLDSVFSEQDSIKFSLYESNFFMRDFDPNEEFGTSQPYYSNKSLSNSETISDAVLEANMLTFLNADNTPVTGDYYIKPSNSSIVLTEPDNEDEDDLPQVTARLAPSIRVKLDTTFWHNKIIAMQDDNALTSANNFYNHFRGLYFKTEAVNNKGCFIITSLGAAGANITMYYHRDNTSTTEDDTDVINETYAFRFGANSANFFDNNFNITTPTPDPTNGDARLYLKGGSGSLAEIKLFNGDSLDADNTTDNAFETWKKTYVNTDENGKFQSSKRLVNEANLVFYVDQTQITANEPERIYLYDANNNRPLVDYYLDASSASVPTLSLLSHLGKLQRVNEEPTGNGIKYKLKITEHINNLLLRDSTNITLGLSVSGNVTLEETFAQRQILTTDGTKQRVPLSAVITPRGTILHGNNTADTDKKVYLEIFYTEPEN